MAEAGPQAAGGLCRSRHLVIQDGAGGDSFTASSDDLRREPYPHPWGREAWLEAGGAERWPWGPWSSSGTPDPSARGTPLRESLARGSAARGCSRGLTYSGRGRLHPRPFVPRKG